MKNLFFFFFISISFLNAQTVVDGEWERLTEPEPNIYNLQMKTNGVIYANEYRSFDDGKTWEKHDLSLSTIGYDGIIIERESFRDAAGIDNNKIRFSKDHGATYSEKIVKDLSFTYLTSLSNGKWIAVGGVQSDSRRRIFISEDEGDTWSEVFQQFNLFGEPFEIKEDIIFVPRSRNTADFEGHVVNLSTGQYKTADLKGFNQSIFETPIFSIAPNEDIWLATDAGISKSTDNGWTWEVVQIDSVGDRNYNSNITILSTGDLIASFDYLLWDFPRGKKIFKSTDNGLTWEQLPLVPSMPNLHHRLSVEGTLFGFGGGLLLHSSDDGETWDYVFEGIGFSNMEWLNKDSIFGQSYSRLLKSTNGGDTWESIEENKIEDWLGIQAISNIQNNKMLVRTPDNLYLTDDFGASFKKLNFIDTVFSKGFTYTNELHITPENEFLFSTDDGLFISIDEGVRWTRLVDSVKLWNIKISKNNNWIATGYKLPDLQLRRSFRSIDQGASWEILPDFLHYYEFDNNNNLVAYRNAHDSLWISEDFGDSFQFQGVPFTISNFRFDSEGSIFYDGFFVPHNEKNKRLQLPKPSEDLLINPEEALFIISFLSPYDQVYAFDSKNGLFRFNRPTTDFSEVSSIDDFEFEKQAIVYPNPTKSEITIILPEPLKNQSNFLLFNQLGQIVFNERLSKNQTTHQVKWNDLPKGIYFYLIENEGIGGKIVIE